MSLAVLASGTGSNLQALLDAAARREIPTVALVVANLPCQALDRAAAAGVPTRLFPHQTFAQREDFDRAVVDAIQSAGADLICLAGFMRLVTPVLLEAFRGRVLNIHPSLLPAFPGLHAQRQALEARVRVAGCTVHFVDSGTDTGAIIGQAAVPVLTNDTEATLSERILAQEHQLYPAAVAWVAAGAIRLEGGRAVASSPHLTEAPQSVLRSPAA